MDEIGIKGFNQLNEESKRRAIEERDGKRALAVYLQMGEHMLEVFLSHESRKANLLKHLRSKGCYIISCQEDLTNAPREQEENIRALESSLTSQADDKAEALRQVMSFPNACYIDGKFRDGAWHIVSLYDGATYYINRAIEAGKPVLITVDSRFELKPIV